MIRLCGAIGIIEVVVEVEVEVVGLLWLPLERDIHDVIVLATFIERIHFQ